MKDRLLIFVLMWLFPWGLATFGFWLADMPWWCSIFGIASCGGIAFVLAMAKAAKDN